MQNPYVYMTQKYGNVTGSPSLSWSGKNRMNEDWSKYMASFDRFLQAKELNTQANQPVGTRSFQVSSSGQTRTPEQQQLLSSAIGDLSKRLGTIPYAQDYGTHLTTIRNAAMPFERVDIPQPGQEFAKEQQMMKSAILGGQFSPAVGGGNIGVQQSGAQQGLSPEAIASVQAANQRGQYAAAMNALNEFNLARIPEIESGQREAASLSLQQEDMARNYELALLQQAYQQMALEQQREAALMSNYGALLEPTSWSQSMQQSFPVMSGANSYTIPGLSSSGITWS